MKWYHSEWQLFLLMHIHNSALVIFGKCFSFFPLTHSTWNMSVYLEQTIQCHLRSMITPNFGYTLRTPLAPLMAATFIQHPLHQNILFTKTTRVSSCKTASLAVPLISSLYILWQGGRGLHQMHGYMKMPVGGILIFQMENIILQMLDFWHANNFSSPTIVYSITLLNGVMRA